MALTRGRVVKATPDGDATHVDEPLLAPGPSRVQRRRVPAEAVEAYLRATKALDAARIEADAIIARARESAASTAGDAAREAKREAEATLAAAWLALRRREESSSERDLDRTVTLAIALAERLVGAAIELDPKLVASIARQALAEARGARRAVIEAHPLDVAALGEHLATLPLAPDAVELRADSSLARGDLRLHTDLGTLDAKLHPRLERLAAALRDALR